MKKLSVIVPVYNVQAYVMDCLQSIAEQQYAPIEVIVVDDGSTDAGGVMAEDFCRDRENFYFYRKANGGLMSAWMYGVEKSTGDYIGFVDSDDWIAPDMYSKLMETAENTGADIVMCNLYLVTCSTVTPATKFPLKEYYGPDAIRQIHDKVFPSLRGGNVSSARWNKVFKRQLFVENMQYCRDQSRYCEDRYIVPACLFSANTFACVHAPLYYYRMRRTANSKSPSAELVASLDRLYEIQRQMLTDKGLYQRYSGQLALARLNYLKIAYERNLVNAKGLIPSHTFAKQLLGDDIRAIVLANREQCVHKFGRCLYLAAKHNSPWVLMAGAMINKLLVKNRNKDWFA